MPTSKPRRNRRLFKVKVDKKTRKWQIPDSRCPQRLKSCAGVHIATESERVSLEQAWPAFVVGPYFKCTVGPIVLERTNIVNERDNVDTDG